MVEDGREYPSSCFPFVTNTIISSALKIFKNSKTDFLSLILNNFNLLIYSLLLFLVVIKVEKSITIGYVEHRQSVTGCCYLFIVFSVLFLLLLFKNVFCFDNLELFDI